MTTPLRPLRPLRSPLRRRTTAASAALLLGLALTACGSDDSEVAEVASTGSSESTTDTPAPDDDTTDDETTSPAADPTSSATEDTAGDLPSEDELATALLTLDDVPADFAVLPDDGEDDGDGPFDGTCLADVGQFKDALGSDPDEEAEVELGLETPTAQSSVTSQAEAYTDPAFVADAFATYTDELQSCTSVQTTSDDGVVIDLTIAYDDTVDLPGAEDQLAFDVTGTLGAEAQSYPVSFGFVVALTGPFISVVGTTAIGEDTTGIDGSVKDLAVLQAERVAQLG